MHAANAGVIAPAPRRDASVLRAVATASRCVCVSRIHGMYVHSVVASFILTPQCSCKGCINKVTLQNTQWLTLSSWFISTRTSPSAMDARNALKSTMEFIASATQFALVDAARIVSRATRSCGRRETTQNGNAPRARYYLSILSIKASLLLSIPHTSSPSRALSHIFSFELLTTVLISISFNDN